MDISSLRDHLNTVVRLSFSDGEEVDALLLGVDLEAHDDLTYEVRRIVRRAEPSAIGTAEGTIVVAPITELAAWDLL